MDLLSTCGDNFTYAAGDALISHMNALEHLKMISKKVHMICYEFVFFVFLFFGFFGIEFVMSLLN
jgi:hypothetical protein